MSKVFAIVLPVLLGLSILECNSKSKPPAPSSPIGVYQYSGYDKAGKKVVEGLLEITSIESNRLKGTWQLKPIGNAEKIGPQVGTGTLVGELNKDTVNINLNPNMADNNVNLTGKIEGAHFHGDWSFSGFAGVISQGTFEGRRK